MKKYYKPFGRKPDAKIFRDTETNEVWSEIHPFRQRASDPSRLIKDFMYVEFSCKEFVESRKLAFYKFIRQSEHSYVWYATEKYILDPFLVVDFYSFEFNKFEIKNYKFTDDKLIFSDDSDQSMFEFYFAEIIN